MYKTYDEAYAAWIPEDAYVLNENTRGLEGTIVYAQSYADTLELTCVRFWRMNMPFNPTKGEEPVLGWAVSVDYQRAVSAIQAKAALAYRRAQEVA